MADQHGRRLRVAVLLLPDVYLRLEDAADAEGVKPAKWIEDLVTEELLKLAKRERVL